MTAIVKTQVRRHWLKVVVLGAVLACAIPIVACGPALPDIDDAPYQVVITTPYKNPEAIIRYCPDGGWEMQNLTYCVIFTEYYAWDALSQHYVYSDDREVFCGTVISMVEVTDRRTGIRRVVG